MKKGVKVFLGIIGFLLVGFGIFVGVGISMMDIEVSTEFTYKAPDLPDLKLDFELGYGQWAAAINGSVVMKSADELAPQPTASTAKMILALAVVDKKPLSEEDPGEGITITEEMYNKYVWYVANNGSSTAVTVGERISEYDALCSVLLASSNNMADSLAIWAFGSLDGYKTYATEMLQKLGVTNTKIGVDASGYDPSTTSTAEDLAKIATALMNQPVLAEIVGRSEAVVPVAGNIKNTNQLVGTDGIIGVKTGYIGDASGYCLVSAYKESSETITVALLGAPTREASFDDTQRIVEELQKIIVTRNLVAKEQEVGHFATWWAGNIPIKATEDLNGVFANRAEIELVMTKNTGKMTFASSEINYEVSVEAEEFPREPTFWQKFLHVFGWQAQ
jgi:D-alanyl-D-alanine carboxypeptidase (penicillin-binding protein 5/6)